MLDWESLEPDSKTKELLWKLGNYLDDYSDAAAQIENAYEKYIQPDAAKEISKLSPFEWMCVQAFLSDNIPPGNLKLLGNLIGSILKEAEFKNVTFEFLGMKPKIRGRKNTMKDKELRQLVYQVKQELKISSNKTLAYEAVGKQMHKAPDTVRRYYERWKKDCEQKREKNK
ncbi:MAG: hypothetical protein JKY26_00030 [Pseudomonas sp.]|nr:hypothetical protein [Pseudomonas sp.]